MSEADRLSLADLEMYGHVWGTGRERRALCPFCGDEHGRDRGHACLAVNVDTGAWTCHRCGRSGLLDEHKTKREDAADPLRPKRRRARRSAPVAPPAPSPAVLAEDAAKRARLRRLWPPCVPVDAPEAEPGAAYLLSRGIPLDVAAAGRVRYRETWPDWAEGTNYPHAAVVFPVQDAAGRLVGAVARYLVKRTDSDKVNSAGHPSRGVFVATPGALDVAGLTICEGAITALSMAACGFPAVALGGQNAPPWLARRLALRDVVIALDEGEQKTEAAAAALVRALAAYGARPYRLRLPAGVDVNDRLRAVGLPALRAELSAAICGALAPRERGT